MITRLLTIGDFNHPEFMGILASVNQQTTAEHRETIDAAIHQPVTAITHVLIARTSRTLFPRERMDRLLSIYPLARFATLLSSGCEGEFRTGQPWPSCERIYWHRAMWELSRWLDQPLDQPASPAEVPGTIGIVSRERQIGEGLADSLCHLEFSATSLTPGQLSMSNHWSHLFWDDSVVSCADDWNRHRAVVAGHASGACHHWLVSSPRVKDWLSLRPFGFQTLHSKPLEIESILCAIKP